MAPGLFAQQTVGYDAQNPQSLDLDKQRCEEAWREAEALRLDFRRVVDRLHLVKIREDLSRMVWSSELSLGGSAA